MKKLALLPTLMISFCSVPTVEHKILAEDETLHIHLKQPILDVTHIVVEHDEINWYDIYNGWFVLDYNSDPSRYYINLDIIAIWGIER